MAGGISLGFLSAAGASFTALLPIANPLGAAPVYASLSADWEASERARQARLAALAVVAVLVVSTLAGRFVLQALGISLPVLRIAGGLIVAHAGWSLVTQSPTATPAEHAHARTKEQVWFTPLALPLIAGPGAMGIVIGLATTAASWQAYPGIVLAVVGIGAATYLCLRLAGPLDRLLGPTGLGAFNRVIGFLVLAIAVELVVDGVRTLVR